MTVGIVDAGQIGSTLAQLLLRSACEVMLAANSREGAERAAAALPGAPASRSP